MDQVLAKSNNWRDFRSNIAPLGAKDQGDRFELLTKFYLQLHPTYRTKLKHVWRLQEVPPRIRRLLNLPRRDEGIDLVTQTRDGEYWAIQCKYRADENTSLTRRELSTFTDLAFGVCKNISLGVVCTTADRFSQKLRLHGDRLEFLAGAVWRALDPQFFRRVHSALAGKAVRIAPKRPRIHQKRAIQNAVNHFVAQGNARGKLISPCGSGKSLTGYWMAEALNARTVLVAVPSLALIKQSLDVWATEAVANGKQFNWICVCSDAGVARTERDDAVVLVQDLGVRVHTDSAEIAGWLRASKHGTSVVFTTYQSGRAIADAARSARFTFDVAILDEAHNTVGKKGSLFSHLLHDKNIRVKKRIFMTATERRYAGESDQIISMEDPAIYGESFEMLSFKKALDCRPPILSDYQVVTIAVTREEIAELIKKNKFVRPDRGQWSEDIEAEMLAAAVALRKAIQRRPIKHAVSFHSSIARAKAFKETQDVLGTALPSCKPLDIFHVSGAMPTAARSRIMEEFEDARRALITNARCLTEGVDVPNIDCVLFADPRRSTIDIVQAVGRALRTAQGKKCGYVVIPVLMDGDRARRNGNQESAFDPVLIVLRALAANDERIVEHFRTVAEGRQSRPGRTQFDLVIPDGLVIDTDRFVSSIELRFWSRLAKLAWRPFKDAREFVRRLGLPDFKGWLEYCKGEVPGKGTRPDDIPSNPGGVYKEDGWLSWGDWLGTGVVASSRRQFRPFKQARRFVRRLGLRSYEDWRKYYKGELHGKGTKPDDIPTGPDQTYSQNGWAGWGDWLGTGVVASSRRQFRPFKQARRFVRRLGLRNQADWVTYCKGELRGKGRKPDDIPTHPSATYKEDGWLNLGDWLGTGTVASQSRHFRPFRQARRFVRRLGLRNREEWNKYCKGELRGKGRKPDGIPTKPYATYKEEGWVNLGDWLGTGTVANQLRHFRPFKEARRFVRRLGLRNRADWITYCKGELRAKGRKPDDIPTHPYETYREDGWVNLGDWLGTGTVATSQRQYRSFRKAREFARLLHLRNEEEWRKYCKAELSGKGTKPDDIPACPNQTYKGDGWAGMADWLGTARTARHRAKRPRSGSS